MRAGVVVRSLALPLLTARAGADEPPKAPTPEIEVEVRAPAPSPAVAALDPGVAGSTLRRPELERPGLSAAEALRTQVGTSITETGGLGAASTASIRGATAAETPVYLGGVRMNDDVAGTADLSTLPLWLIDRIEIYRGNAPFEADRYGIGGAIFFQPLRPHATHAAFGLHAGSYGSKGAFAVGTLGNEKRGALVGVSYAGATNDYEFTGDAGQTERWQNADATLVDVWLSGRTEIGEGSADVLVNHFNREQGAVRLATVQTHESRQTLSRTLAAVTGRAPLGARTWLELRTSTVLAQATIDDPLRELLPASGTPGTRLEQHGERIEQEHTLSADLGETTRARVGAQAASERLRRYENAQIADVPPALDALRASARVSATAEQDVGRVVTLRGLLALECHATSTGAPFGLCDSFEPVGRVGAHARAGALSGFLALGRYSRPPTLGELYGTSLVSQGNPTLGAESGVTLDVGARLAHALPNEQRPLYAAVSGYARRAHDLVAPTLNDQGFVTPQNVGVADVLGLELEAGTGFARYFSADVALTLMDFRDSSPGRTLENDILPYHSRLIAAPGLTATSPDLESRWLSRATFGAKLVYQSNRYADFGGLGVIPEQASLDLDVALEGFDRLLWLRARVTDVLDAERYDIVGFPLPGRSFFLSLEFRSSPR